MKFASYNIQYGVGRDGKFDLPRIAASLQGADIIALQEVTRNFPRNGGADLVAGLQALLPGHFTVFEPAMDLDFGLRDKQGKPLNQRLHFGNMVLSRWPIIAARNLLLPRTRRYNRGNLQRAALEALIVAPGGPLRVYSVHIDHVSLEERIAQIRYLKERIYAYPMEGGAISGAPEYGFPEPPCPEAFVLMGDFNMVRGSPEYIVMTGETDYVEGRQIVAHHPVDAGTLGGGLHKDAVSWVDDKAPQKNRLIDYAFVHAALAGSVGNPRIDAAATGSDHLPLWFDLEWAEGGG